MFERIADTKRCNPKGPYKYIMHNKFCVIDLKTVIHGSYNYTNKANFNNESISIETSRQIAEQYASQFIKLYNEN
ncbi:phospholipase D-like domain-containing protein [Sphingobacterium sp. KU25419]|nr:phospholipase D-like domain-containing protein [Sphingobacterium sp. KU25419]